MILELMLTVFVAAYVVVVILGHGLLFVALLKLLREDYFGRRRRQAESDRPSAAERTVMSIRAFRRDVAGAL